MNHRDLALITEVRRACSTGEARAMRVAAHMTLAEVAEYADVYPSTVYKWETGTNVPRGAPGLAYARLIRMLARQAPSDAAS